ncbi:MAG: hypothetical protein JTT11_06380, partial [Candidatus Brockarchaeota archaeon]|nr:hypothetical protein [Candidatus Brockarchaeota archaeon]
MVRARNRAAPGSGERWRGIHVLLNDNEETDALASEVPKLANIGVNVLVAEVDYNYAYASHPELRGPNPITKDRAR